MFNADDVELTWQLQYLWQWRLKGSWGVAWLLNEYNNKNAWCKKSRMGYTDINRSINKQSKWQWMTIDPEDSTLDWVFGQASICPQPFIHVCTPPVFVSVKIWTYWEWQKNIHWSYHSFGNGSSWNTSFPLISTCPKTSHVEPQTILDSLHCHWHRYE